MSSSSSHSRALAFAVVVLWATAASAQTAPASAPSPADVEAAKAQFAEALDLRNAGDVAGALQHFKAAYGFVPTPITGLEVGRTLVALGRKAEARRVLLEAANMPKKPGESDKATQSRADAAKLVAELEPGLATLSIKADPRADAVLLDDQPLPGGAKEPAFVDPGHHVVTVTGADGKKGRAEIDVAAGERKGVSAAFDAPAQPTATRLALSPLVYAGFGVGAVGVLAGIGTGIGAFVTASDVKRECPNGLCPPSAHGTLDTSAALGTVSTIAFAVGGVGAAVGVVGLFLSKRVPVERVTLLVGPGSLGVRGTF